MYQVVSQLYQNCLLMLPPWLSGNILKAGKVTLYSFWGFPKLTLYRLGPLSLSSSDIDINLTPWFFIIRLATDTVSTVAGNN